MNAVQMLWVNLIMDTFAALALATEPPGEEILLRHPQHKSAPILTDVMWRNVIGHACFQVLVLILMIFLGTTKNWLVYDYQVHCLQESSLTGSCEVFNPFYANDRYYSKKAVEQWNTRRPTFDPTLLAKMKFDGDEAAPREGDGTQKLVHYTLIFQVFVFMQIFNQLNARKLEQHEINVFKDFFNNYLFIFIFLLTFIIQMLLVNFGGKPVQAARLTITQNLLCMLIGAGELPWGLFLKYAVPLKWFHRLNVKDQPAEPALTEASMVSTLKKSSLLHRSETSSSKGSRKALSNIISRSNDAQSQELNQIVQSQTSKIKKANNKLE